VLAELQWQGRVMFLHFFVSIQERKIGAGFFFLAGVKVCRQAGYLLAVAGIVSASAYADANGDSQLHRGATSSLVASSNLEDGGTVGLAGLSANSDELNDPTEKILLGRVRDAERKLQDPKVAAGSRPFLKRLLDQAQMRLTDYRSRRESQNALWRQSFPPASTNTTEADALLAEATNASTDQVESLLLKSIKQTRDKLHESGVSPAARSILQGQLAFLAQQFVSHRASMQAFRQYSEAVRTNIGATGTNMPDRMEEAMAPIMAIIQSRLADPALAPATRTQFEMLVEHNTLLVATHQRHVGLLNDYRSAIMSQNPEQVAASKEKLRQFLLQQLEAKTGKKYPGNMTYEEVNREFIGRVGPQKTKRAIVLVVLSATLVLPFIFILIHSLRKRA
jgi:hypothetical protein